jgi:hypothetical protein
MKLNEYLPNLDVEVPVWFDALERLYRSWKITYFRPFSNVISIKTSNMAATVGDVMDDVKCKSSILTCRPFFHITLIWATGREICFNTSYMPLDGASIMPTVTVGSRPAATILVSIYIFILSAQVSVLPTPYACHCIACCVLTLLSDDMAFSL